MTPRRSNMRHAVRWAKSASAPLGFLTFICAIVLLCALALGVEAVWRPLPEGPATAPWTAVGLGLLGLALIPGRLADVFAAAAVFVALARLVELSSGGGLLPVPVPWSDTLAREIADGTPVRMGWNTAVMIGLCGLGSLFMRMKLVSAGFTAIAVASGAVLVALLGYTYGQVHFHGEMALPTLLVGGIACAGTMFRHADRGWLRVLLGVSNTARAARQQIGLIVGGIFAVGFLLTLAGMGGSAETMFAVQAMVISVLVIAATSVGFRRVELAERRLRWTLEVQAMRDALTGILNRRGLFARMDEMCGAARGSGRCFSVFAMDIDHFKSINDRFGHAAGDVVLAVVAERLAAALEPNDLIGRTGGEEFTVVAREVTGRAAGDYAERLRRVIEVEDFSGRVPGLGPVTLSIGIASTGRCNDGLLDLLSRADQALYRAKERRRNAVSF
ncbi:MAG: GGDEF domain-containing protein [Zavarzinia sp.]|nr:GGDEF domain-containing protein [Zavarzinia sp.]